MYLLYRNVYIIEYEWTSKRTFLPLIDKTYIISLYYIPNVCTMVYKQKQIPKGLVYMPQSDNLYIGMRYFAILLYETERNSGFLIQFRKISILV